LYFDLCNKEKKHLRQTVAEVYGNFSAEM